MGPNQAATVGPTQGAVLRWNPLTSLGEQRRCFDARLDARPVPSSRTQVATAPADARTVATHEENPWWELEGRPAPHVAQFQAEAERLRQERTRPWREHAEASASDGVRTSVPPLAHRGDSSKDSMGSSSSCCGASVQPACRWATAAMSFPLEED